MRKSLFLIFVSLLVGAPALVQAELPEEVQELIESAPNESEKQARDMVAKTATAVATQRAAAEQQAAEVQQTAKAEQQTAAVAEQTAAAAQATSRAQDAQASFDLAKSGKLMSSGVTAGLALAVQTPLYAYGQKAADTVAMPYLMVLPGYFAAAQPVREYCAAAWGIGDDSGATAAAVGAARKSARIMLDAIEADLKANRDPADVVATWFPNSKPSSKEPEDIAAATLERKYATVLTTQTVSVLKGLRSADTVTRANAVTAETEVLDSLTFHQWNPTLRGKCTARSIGIWIGRPLTYSTSTQFRSDERRVHREISPVVAFGLGYTPHAYLSFLVGVTLANVEYADDNKRSFWTGTAAIGGNLDLLGSLFK